jgi:hypothetical protein
MDRGGVMDLMDWDGGMNNMRLNSLLLNHRLDMLMHVMMNCDDVSCVVIRVEVILTSLASNCWGSLGRTGGAVCLSGVSVLSGFSV